MPLTSNSDAMGRFHESAFNKILSEFIQQRPATFNYATRKVIMTKSYCIPINMNEDLKTMKVKKCTQVKRLPIIGSDDPSQGIDFCLQISELKVDFNPSSEIALPTELGDLIVQQFALKGTIWAGLGGDIPIANKNPFPVNKIILKDPKSGIIDQGLWFVFPKLQLNTFSMSLHAKVAVVDEDGFLKLTLLGIELEEMKPEGLENSIEYYLKHVLDHVVFPKLKIAVSKLTLIKSNINFSLKAASEKLPFNPEVSNNYLSIFLNIN
jgi:hypothetical protein